MNDIDRIAADVPVRRVPGSDRMVIVMDFGATGDEWVEIVDETALVVVEDDQYEFDLPAGAQAFITNGVLTIEVDE